LASEVPVSLKWTLVATVAVVVLVVATFVAFEISTHPSPSQRQRIANVVWPVAGLAVVGLWGWFFVNGGRRKRR
jgi:hypothetical protein